MTVLDKLTYAGNLASLEGLPADRFRFVHGDICDAALVDQLFAEHDAVVHYAAESHNDNSLENPRPFLETNIVGTYTLLEACASTTSGSTTSDRRGLRRPRARRPGEVHRADPLQPVQPVLVDEGRQRPAGARLGALVRREGDDLELLEQLRAVPARREVHPPPDHERAARRAPQALRGGRERARLDPRERPLLRRADDPRARRIGETYLIGADGEKNNKEVVELILTTLGRPADAYDHVTDRPGTTSATRSTRPAFAPSSGGRRGSRTSRRASPTRSTGTASTRRGGRRRRTPPRPATRRRVSSTVRYLITGASGMLGCDLQSVLAGRDVTALGRADLDVTDAAAVAAAVAGHDVSSTARPTRRSTTPRRTRMPRTA